MPALGTSDVVAVIGAGTMGAGIAQVAANAGHSVLLYDVSKDAIDKGINYISTGLTKLVERKKITTDERDQLLQRIAPVTDINGLAPARLVIEAIVENLDIKQKLFVQLEQICSKDTIFASNTSSLSLTAIAAILERPQHLSGMHFFNPAPIMKLVEVISGVATDPKVAETVFDTAIVWGKKAVHVKSTPGFIVNRVARPYYAEALRVLEEGGADPSTIDCVMRESGGFRMGPFELMDLIGHDVNYAVTKSVFNAHYNDPRFLPSLIQKELIDAGYLGRKTGRGFYNYGNGQAMPEPNTAPIVPPPTHIIVYGELGIAQPIIDLLADIGTNLTFEQNDSSRLIVDGVHVAITDGRTATERSLLQGVNNLVLFDLALDYTQSKRIALSAADQASPKAISVVAGMFQAIGKVVSIIDDIPGMLVMRTICMLANEGADTVNQGICDAQAVDTAMQSGVNYPLGPLAWAEKIGIDNVVNVLNNMGLAYGEDRYRISPLLQRKVYAGNTFYG